VLAVGDGALGFWSALREVFPETASSATGSTSSPTCSKITDDAEQLLAFSDLPRRALDPSQDLESD
jgi:hypothetical protein